MTPVKRITKILIGAAIYWMGYSGFLTHLESPFYASLCLFLIVSGLLVAGLNSSLLYKGE